MEIYDLIEENKLVKVLFIILFTIIIVLILIGKSYDFWVFLYMVCKYLYMWYSFLFGYWLLTLVLGKFLVWVVLRGKMSNDKNVRSRHTSYLNRKKSKGHYPKFWREDRFRLEGVRVSLKEKSDVLKKPNVKILAALDEDAIGYGCSNVAKLFEK